MEKKESLTLLVFNLQHLCDRHLPNNLTLALLILTLTLVTLTLTLTLVTLTFTLTLD